MNGFSCSWKRSILILCLCCAVSVFNNDYDQFRLPSESDAATDEIIIQKQEDSTFSEQQEVFYRHHHERLPSESDAPTDEITIQKQEGSTVYDPQEFFYRHHHERLQALVNESSILNWGPRHKPQAFAPFFDQFREENRPLQFPKQYKTGHICRYAKMLEFDGYVPRPHVLFLTPFDENWGALSTQIPNRTAGWYDLDQELKRNKCSRDLIEEYLNHDATRAVITVQFQDLDHHKVHSIPLGLNTPQIHPILSIIGKADIPSRNQLLMVNSRPRTMRQELLETVVMNFNGTVQNTFGSDQTQYYQEMQRSKFILSPGGLGLDCYRHWEALYLGTVPVLEHLNRTDGWFRTLQELPVAWIDHYDNLTAQWLEEQYPKIMQKAKSYKYEKLTQQYWINLIRSLAPTVAS